MTLRIETAYAAHIAAHARLAPLLTEQGAQAIASGDNATARMAIEALYRLAIASAGIIRAHSAQPDYLLNPPTSTDDDEFDPDRLARIAAQLADEESEQEADEELE